MADHEGAKMTTRSMQVIDVNVCRVKIEIRIKEFDALMGLHDPGVKLCSEGVTSPQHPTAIWKLGVYPNGLSERTRNHCYFYIDLTGPAVTNKETLDTVCQMYCINSEGEKVHVFHNTRHKFKEAAYYWAEFCKEHSELREELHEDGSLLLVAEVQMLVPDHPAAVVRRMPDEWALKVRHFEALGGLLDKKLNTDCTIEVGDKSFRVHKGLLAANSPTFAAMFGDGSNYKEASEGVMRIKEFSPDPVRAMLEFIYKGEVDWTACSEGEADLLRLADKYELLALKEHVEQRLAATPISTPAQLVGMIILAGQHNCSILKKACADHLAAHRSSIVESPEWKELKAASPEMAFELFEMLE